MTGGTTLIHGTITHSAACTGIYLTDITVGTNRSTMEDGISVYHGIAHGTTTDGIVHGIMTDGTVHGILTVCGITHGTVTAGITEVGTTLTTTDGVTAGITEVGTIHTTTDGVADGTAGGIHTGITLGQATQVTSQVILESRTGSTTTNLAERQKSRLLTLL